MKTLKWLVISPRRITSTQRREQLQARDIMRIPNRLEIEVEFRVLPDILEGAVLENGDNLDEKWIKDTVADMGYHWVHLLLNDDDWDDLGLRRTLYGQSKAVEGQVVTYGRWHERSRYQQSHRYEEPVRSLPEAALGAWHEADHGFRRMFNLNSNWTHYFFYGYDRFYTHKEERELKPKRYARTPDPLIGWHGLPWGRLPEIETREPVKEIDYGVKITKRHPKNLERYSWAGNDPQALIFHTLLGTLEGSLSWLEQIHLSYNYLIGVDGKIVEQIPIERSAWHAGVLSNPSDRVVSFFKGVNPNKKAVAIAFERNGEQQLNKEQVGAAVALIKIIGQKTASRYTLENTFAHHEITDYKPVEVVEYRRQVMASLEGEKEPEEEEKIKLLKLRIALLQLKIKLLQLLGIK